MEFGIFMPNSRNGYLMSEAAPQYSPTYAHLRDIVQAGEKNGFTFALTMSSLRGHGGSTRFWDDSMESMTTMAALARDTDFMKLIGSVQLLAVHPALAARAATAVSDAADGRFALNLVPGGWHPKELESLGVWPGYDYNEYRWKFATEYATVVSQLWNDGVTNFQGQYFKFDDLKMGPLPHVRIPIVAAGASDDAINFVKQYADYNFRLAWGGLDALSELMQKFQHDLVDVDRPIKPYVALGVVVDDTDEKAEAKLAHYVEHADHAAIEYMMTGAVTDSAKGGTSEILASMDQKGAVQMSTDFITGSPESVARQLDEWAELDVAGYMLVLTDYVTDIERLGRDVFPLMKNFDARRAVAEAKASVNAEREAKAAEPRFEQVTV